MQRPWAVLPLLAVIGSASCGSPTNPSSNLNLRSGLQTVTFMGMSISSDPLLPACTPFATPPAGPRAVLRAMLQLQDGDWVARSPSGEGTLELRLRETGTRGDLGAGVAGTIKGGGPDAGLFTFIPPRGVSVDLDGAGGQAILDGEVWGSSYVSGRISGRVTFSDTAGAVGTCAAIQWMMQPAPGSPG
jgi:hypothetical protein